MATRFHKTLTKENHKPAYSNEEPVPDIADFMMNDWFYGGGMKKDQSEVRKKKEEESRNVSTGRLTQEWLEEAKRMVADSPSSRPSSPARFIGSPTPRFASANGGEPTAKLERRDPLSRSARRHRATQSISDEILLKTTARKSISPATETSPASAVHQWFSNIINPNPNPLTPQTDPNPITSPPLPPKSVKTPRKSRFRDATPAVQSSPVLSPPRNLVEPGHRRSLSSSTCSFDACGAPRRLSFSRSSDLAVVSDDVKEINAFLSRQRAVIERISNGEVSAKAKIVLSGPSASSDATSLIVAAICYAWLLENGEEEDNGVVVPVVNMRRGKMWKHRKAAWLFHHLGIDASALLFTDEVDLEGLLMTRQLNILVIGQDVIRTNGEVGSQCTVLTDNYCEDAYNLLQAPILKKLLLAGILLDTHNLNGAAKFFTNRDAEAVQLLSVGSSSNYRYEFYEQLMRDHRSNLFLEAMKNNYGKPSTVACVGIAMQALFGMPKVEISVGLNYYQQFEGFMEDSGSGDEEENGASLEPRLSTRKSTSISPKDAKGPASIKHKVPTVAVPAAPVPAAATVPTSMKAPEKTPRGKNKNFFAKFFGFGSK